MKSDNARTEYILKRGAKTARSGKMRDLRCNEEVEKKRDGILNKVTKDYPDGGNTFKLSSSSQKQPVNKDASIMLRGRFAPTKAGNDSREGEFKPKIKPHCCDKRIK